MFARSILLPLAVTLAVSSVGCSRIASPTSTLRAAAAHAQALAESADEPCDDAVVRRIDAFKLVVQGRLIPAMAVAGGPDRPEVIEMPSPNRSTRTAAIDTIVLHHTASAAPAKNIGGFFSQPSAKVSAHYTVDKTGYIVSSVPDSASAWHAGRSKFKGTENVNNFSVGIEICNTGEANDPYPAAQYEALGRLMAYLMTTHKVGWDRVTRHRDIAMPLGRKDDTSDGFSRPTLEKATAAAGGPKASAMDSMVPAFLTFN